MSAPESMDPARQEAQRHFPTLDGLRGLAILLVIPHNADVFADASGLLWPAALLAHAGWIGVQLFFVLSGFLITSNLLDTQHADNYYKSFFARRTLRIFPLYYGVLFVALIVLPLFVTQTPQIRATHVHQLWLWTFLVNWAEPFGKVVHGFSHFWSLAVEEQFYLVWPFLVRRLSARGVWILSASLIVAALVIRCVLLAGHAESEMVYMFTFCRMDALAAGAACAAVLRMSRGSELIRRYADRLWLVGLGIALVGAIVTRAYTGYDIGTFTIGYTLLSISFALLLLGAIVPHTKQTHFYQSFLSLRALRSVGKYSFAMYVFHMPIQLSIGVRVLPHLKSLGSAYPLLYPIVIAILSYAAALLSYHLYEKHFLKLKHWFVPTHIRQQPEPGAQQPIRI